MSVPKMDKRRRIDLPFRELLAAQYVETEDHYEAWRKAMTQYHQQQGEHDAAANIATTEGEIPLPLPESILTNKKPGPEGLPVIHENLPAINAAGLNHILSQCKPNDPNSQEIMKQNTARLVECGLVDKLGLGTPQPQTPTAETTTTPSPKEFETSDKLEEERKTQSSGEPGRERNIDLSRVQTAHQRYWSAMGGSTKDFF